MKLPRSKSLYLLAVLIVCLLGLLIYLNRYSSCCALSEPRLPVAPSTIIDPTQNQTTGPLVQIRDISIPVELATSSEAIRQGLSGRSKLDSDKGLLFIFNQPDRYRFWMPEMNFPIDIIWLNNDRVVGFHERADNNFDPQNPVFYQAPEAVRLVLEVNADFVAKHQIQIGDRVVLKQIK